MSAPRQVPGVENRRRAGRDGTERWSFRVRWTDPRTGQRRSEEFATQEEALDWRARVRLARRAGRLGDLTAGRQRLAAFVEQEWWPAYALVELERSTLKSYASVWNRHALPRIGQLELRQVDAGIAARLRLELERDGVGPSAIAKTLTMLQSVFTRAVVWGRVPVNPFAAVRKPGVRAAAVEPIAPEAVEAVARALAAQAGGTPLLALLVGYAGLRPEEALALQWRHVRARTLLVEQKNVDGVVLGWQKVRGKPPRTVELLAPLAGDLAAARPPDAPGDAFVIARADGAPWREHDYRNWRRRRYRPAAEAAGVSQPGRPYVLRHSFASLLLHEGRLSPAEIAEQLGHTIQTLFKDYAHVIAELRGQPPASAAERIAAARERPQTTPGRTT